MKIINKILISALLLAFSIQTASAQEKEYLIQLKNHKFTPETFEVPANTKFKLTIENLDKTLEEFESHDLKKEKLVGSGKKITISIKPLKSGQYKFFGDFHQKTARGVIIVK